MSPEGGAASQGSEEVVVEEGIEELTAEEVEVVTVEKTENAVEKVTDLETEDLAEDVTETTGEVAKEEIGESVAKVIEWLTAVVVVEEVVLEEESVGVVTDLLVEVATEDTEGVVEWIVEEATEETEVVEGVMEFAT